MPANLLQALKMDSVKNRESSEAKAGVLKSGGVWVMGLG